MPVEQRDPAVLHVLRRHGRQGRHDHVARESAGPEAEDLRHGEGRYDEAVLGPVRSCGEAGDVEDGVRAREAQQRGPRDGRGHVRGDRDGRRRGVSHPASGRTGHTHLSTAAEPARRDPEARRQVRVLGIPAIRDRVVQGALKLILEPIFEADFCHGSYGYRPRRTAQEAVARVEKDIVEGKTRVIDVDLAADFDTVRHDLLLGKGARRVQDGEILHLLKLMRKASGKRGVPQGGVLSPLLANIYLTEVAAMLERAMTVTQEGAYTRVDYARYADDLVILVDWHRRHDWLLKAVHRRLREELAKLDLRLNEDKSRIVDLRQGEALGFLGFDFRRVRSLRGVWRAQVTPKLTQRTALLGKLRDVFGRSQSQPVDRMITEINPILRGWANYFRIGNARRCFAFVRLWVEQRVRRHLMRARGRNGFGWKRWSTAWLHERLGLFGDYRVRYWVAPESAPSP